MNVIQPTTEAAANPHIWVKCEGDHCVSPKTAPQPFCTGLHTAQPLSRLYTGNPPERLQSLIGVFGNWCKRRSPLNSSVLRYFVRLKVFAGGTRLCLFICCFSREKKVTVTNDSVSELF